MKSAARFVFALIVFFSPSFAATVTAFVAPDSSYEVLEDFIVSSPGGIYVASYTLDSAYVAGMLIPKAGVTVLVEGTPAGGMSSSEKAVLCELDKSGIDVFLYRGSGYHHAKYIVSGNKVLVASENFGSDGYPPNRQGNRGWGVVVEDEALAKELLDIFRHDLLESERFECSGKYEINYANSTGNYIPSFKPVVYYNQSVRLIAAPDAVGEILDLIKSADSSLYIEQFYIYRYWNRKTKEPNLFLEEVLNRAREGKEVKIIMDGSYYNVDRKDIASNYYTNQYVNRAARNETLSIVSRLVSAPFDKVHTKAMIVDNSVLISSINWNLYSPKSNREAGVVVEGDAAQYFRDVFMSDFHGSSITGEIVSGSSLIGLILSSALILFIAARYSRK